MLNQDRANFHQALRAPHEYLQQMCETPPDIYRLSEGPEAITLITSPDAITQVLNDGNVRFTKGPLPTSARLLTGDGTATSWFPPDAPSTPSNFNGLDEWRAAKHGVVSETLSDLSPASSATLAHQLADDISAEWRQGQGVDIYAVAHTLFFRLSLQLLFARPASDAMLEANATIRRSAGAVNRHLHSRLAERIEYFDRIRAPRLEEWRNTPGRHFDLLRERRAAVDFLVDELMGGNIALLDKLSAMKSDGEKSMHHKLRADLIGLLFASYENSATTAAWLIWCLATNDNWQKQIVEEISVHPPSLFLTSSVRSVFPSLWNCLQETLRLYPSVWSLARNVRTDTKLESEIFTAGSTLLISPWLQHRHPAFWDRPEDFDPNRFTKNPAPHKSTFLPFGGGPHSCPAEAFARLSICAVIARWLQSWRFAPASDHPSPQPVLGLTLQPKIGVWVQLEARSRS